MRFAAFELSLFPATAVSFALLRRFASIDAFVQDIRADWPGFVPDDVELAQRHKPLPQNEALLVQVTSEGLIQMHVCMPDAVNSVVFELRFAHCNPQSVDTVFCNMVTGLMRHYGLRGHVFSILAPHQEEMSSEIENTDDVQTVLIPAIEYNRHMWQSDVGTKQEAILRPGEAMARFLAVVES